MEGCERASERAKREEALIFCNRRIYVEKLVNVVTKALQVTFSRSVFEPLR